jgi:formylglycine-generating enzyme required for sulfatase activity
MLVGDLEMGEGSAHVSNCTFVGNTPEGIYVRWNSDLQLNNSIVAYTHSVIDEWGGWGGVGLFAEKVDLPEDLEVSHCCFYGNETVDLQGGGIFDELLFGVIADANANGDPCDSYFNIFMNPTFVDTGEQNFRLDSASHCIGAASPSFAPPVDIEGNLRPDPTGTIADIGAYESPLGTAFVQPPIIVSFGLNAGEDSTSCNLVTMNIAAMHFPTEFMASEGPSFEGAAWELYASTATFALSSGPGTKRVYLKTRNSAGQSGVAVDSIIYAPPLGMSVQDLVIQLFNSGADICLSWSPVPGATSYSMYADTVQGFSVAPLTLLGTTNDTTFVDIDPFSQHDKRFYVVVAAAALDTGGMILVPAGTFSMGSNTWPYTQPIHPVTVPEFYVDRHEVTNAQYKAFCDMQCPPRDYPPNPYFNSMPDYFTDPTYANYPIVNVTWQDAKDYALWVGKRLPTEAEWEFAARGSSNLVYPWGNSWDGSRANISGGYPYPVDSLASGASPFGCLNMIGNVYEWCEDNFHWTYLAAPSNGSAWIDDPPGPERIIRGSAWNGDPITAESAFRNWISPTSFQNNMGFRCAKTAP